ncbi:MAG: entericidin A/B family lipoprotein [Azoarcus sp.]|nr:entericidin A/B family lipoprotein [Azoarcus sp.]
MKRGILFCAVFLTACIFGLSACNTVHGVGRDIEAGGKAVQRAAR